MVFQTAPPHPHSKARWTCAPEFAGGAEANQNGLGDLIPANSILRSAMGNEPLVNRGGGYLSILRCHHCRCRPLGANAISSRVDSGNAGLERTRDLDEAAIGLEPEQ